MILADNVWESLRAQQIGQRPRRLRFKKRTHFRLIWARVTPLQITRAMLS
jgi:hypothetical protein